MTKITDSIIASASDDLSIMVWNLKSYSNIAKLKVQQSGFASLSYSKDHDILVAGQSNGLLNVWYNFSRLINANIKTEISTSSILLTTSKIIDDSSITTSNFQETKSTLAHSNSSSSKSKDQTIEKTSVSYLITKQTIANYTYKSTSSSSETAMTTSLIVHNSSTFLDLNSISIKQPFM
jgi:hypothetical protein